MSASFLKDFVIFKSKPFGPYHWIPYYIFIMTRRNPEWEIKRFMLWNCNFVLDNTKWIPYNSIHFWQHVPNAISWGAQRYKTDTLRFWLQIPQPTVSCILSGLAARSDSSVISSSVDKFFRGMGFLLGGEKKGKDRSAGRQWVIILQPNNLRMLATFSTEVWSESSLLSSSAAKHGVLF